MLKKIILCGGKKSKEQALKSNFFTFFDAFWLKIQLFFPQFSKKKLLLITKFLQLYDM